MIPEIDQKRIARKIEQSGLKGRKGMNLKKMSAAIIGQFEGKEFTTKDVFSVMDYMNRGTGTDPSSIAYVLRMLEKDGFLSMRKAKSGGRDTNTNIYQCIV